MTGAHLALEEVLSIPCYGISLQGMEQTRGKEAEAGFKSESSWFHLSSVRETIVRDRASHQTDKLLIWLCLGFPIHKSRGGYWGRRREPSM